MKVLLFHYIGGGGGKFIANCLSSGFEVAFSNFSVAQELLASKDITDLESRLLDTIPQDGEVKTWHNYEQGCWQLFGKNISEIKSGVVKSTELNPVNKLGAIWLPLVTHHAQDFKNYELFLRDHQVFRILVDATPEFIDCAIRLKWKLPEACLDKDIYRDFHLDLPKLNFDFIVKQWDPRVLENLSQIDNLAKSIGIPVNLNGIQNYINRYVRFHR